MDWFSYCFQITAEKLQGIFTIFDEHNLSAGAKLKHYNVTHNCIANVNIPAVSIRILQFE